MSRNTQSPERDPGWHRRQTEWRLVLGGFVLIILGGGVLLWLGYSTTIALIGVGAALGAIVLFALLLVLLRSMEAWARSE